MAKVRIYCPFFPYPLREAAWQTMINQALAIHGLHHDVEIVSWKTEPHQVQTILMENPTLLPRNLKVTVFSKMGPVRGTPPQWQNLNQLPKMIPSASRGQRVWRSLFSELTPPEIFYYDPLCDQRNLLEEVDLEIYHYSFSYAWLRNPGRYGRKQVVHFHNLESDIFKSRAEATATILERLVHRRTQTRLYDHEVALNHLTDEIWQHAEQDLADYKKRLSKEIRGRVVGPTVSESLQGARKPSEQSILKLGFIGGLDFEPNFLSFRWILDEVAPRLQQEGFTGKISQVGKNAERVKEQARKFPFLELEGFVENVEEWWKSLSFLLVPDVSSAGVRMKILEAIGSGIPVIANINAVHRLHPEVQKSPLLVIKETPEQWVEFILSQKPMVLRNAQLELPFNNGLRASTVYSFLSGLV